MFRLSFRALILLSIATVGTASAAPVSDVTSLGEVNRALRGRQAVVELAGGEILAARDVVMASEVTTWMLDGEFQEIATEDVATIAVAKRSRVKKWATRGAVVGALVSSVGFGYSEADGFFSDVNDAGTIVAGAAGGAAVGAGLASLVGHRVVYQAADSER